MQGVVWHLPHPQTHRFTPSCTGGAVEEAGAELTGAPSLYPPPIGSDGGDMVVRGPNPEHLVCGRMCCRSVQASKHSGRYTM